MKKIFSLIFIGALMFSCTKESSYEDNAYRIERFDHISPRKDVLKRDSIKRNKSPFVKPVRPKNVYEVEVSQNDSVISFILETEYNYYYVPGDSVIIQNNLIISKDE